MSACVSHRPAATAHFLDLPLVPGKYHSKSVNWWLHHDRATAFAHAGVLKRMTGDRCVVESGISGYKVIRVDPSGKKV